MISVVVVSEGSDDPKPALARAVIDKGWALHEVGPHQVSLEDLFVQILERAEQANAAGGTEEGQA